MLATLASTGSFEQQSAWDKQHCPRHHPSLAEQVCQELHKQRITGEALLNQTRSSQKHLQYLNIEQSLLLSGALPGSRGFELLGRQGLSQCPQLVCSHALPWERVFTPSHHHCGSSSRLQLEWAIMVPMNMCACNTLSKANWSQGHLHGHDSVSAAAALSSGTFYRQQ